ncbi:patatin-like phospholipase family protein [Flavihumibacter sediminis]|nr:patatin-like phospholipase family protein [Flavihumibacter sediminis]
MSASNRLGLSLSGGGYRAAAFHLGTLKKLQEMNVLDQVDIISTISGGSITGAAYCTRKNSFEEFFNELYNGLQQKNVIKKLLLSTTFLQLILVVLAFLVPAIILLFTNYEWGSPLLIITLLIILYKFQFQLFPASSRIEKIYDEFFFHKKSLSQLHPSPTLVIGSTNLQTARPFTFSRTWMQDSTYQFLERPIKFNAGDFPIARAVMASTCVPFAFTPITIDKQFFREPSDANRIHPALVDGGVYDNQGIHKIMQRGQYNCSTIITSDAGGGMGKELSFSNTISLLVQTVNVFMMRIKNAQMVQDVYENAAASGKQIAYLSLGWNAENSIPGFISNLEKKQVPDSVIRAHELKEEWVASPGHYTGEITNWLKERINYKSLDFPTAEEKRIARTVGTNLTPLSKQQMDCLIKQASTLTEIQVKLYCPALIYHYA